MACGQEDRERVPARRASLQWYKAGSVVEGRRTADDPKVYVVAGLQEWEGKDCTAVQATHTMTKETPR